MSDWTSATLVDREDWSLESLLRPEELPAFPASYSRESMELGALVDLLPPLTDLAADDRIVRPGDVDPGTGSLAISHGSSTGRGYRAGWSELGLHLDDLLIPFASAIPLIAVSDRHMGLAFSGRFQAIRPHGGVSPALLWSVLSAASGIEARRMTEVGTTIRRPRASELLRIQIPTNEQWWSRVSGGVQEILEQTEVSFLEPPIPASYWMISELPIGGERWDLLLARWDGLPEGEVALRQVCTRIEAGSIDPRETSDVAGPNLWPVMTAGAIRLGSSPDRWVQVGDLSDISAAAGDVLMTQTPRFGALVLQEPMAASRGTLRLVFGDQEWRDAFVRFVNSHAGQRYLSNFATGSTVPHLNLGTARTLRIPDVRKLQFAPAHHLATEWRLSDRLEDLLWR